MVIPSIKIKKILYATDLSENARQAFAYAVSMANLYRAALVIMHVMAEDSGMSAGIINYIGEERWKEIKKKHEEDARNLIIGKKHYQAAIRDALDIFCQTAKDACEDHSMTDEVLVLRGNPADQIVEQAEKLGCDLIVLGTHGRGLLADALMGSTAKRVIRETKIPVLLIRLPEE